MMTKEERKNYVRLTVRIPRDVVRQINILSAEEDRYLYEILEELLRDALQRRKEAK